jgi:hypothetical protein
MKILQVVKNHFWDRDGLTFFGLICVWLLISGIVISGVVKWSEWSCDNYQKITGLESRFIAFDACYVKNEDGRFIRYDAYYKGQ